MRFAAEGNVFARSPTFPTDGRAASRRRHLERRIAGPRLPTSPAFDGFVVK